MNTVRDYLESDNTNQNILPGIPVRLCHIELLTRTLKAK